MATNDLWRRRWLSRKISRVAAGCVEEAIAGTLEAYLLRIIRANTNGIVDPRTEAQSQSTSAS